MVGTFRYQLGYLICCISTLYVPIAYLTLWIHLLERHFQPDRSAQEPKEAPADAVEGTAAENADATAVEALGYSNDGFIMASMVGQTLCEVFQNVAVPKVFFFFFTILESNVCQWKNHPFIVIDDFPSYKPPFLRGVPASHI